MNKNFQLRLILIVYLASLLACVVFYLVGSREEAKFVVDVASGAAVVFTVITALFGDSLQDLIRPIKLTMEVPEVKNSLFDLTGKYGVPIKCYCHHLRVRNARSDRVVKNSRVWLTQILKVNANNQTEDLFLFTVPRLMPWAPLEFDPESRSFCDSQIFDFGLFLPHEGRFEVSVHGKQGGNFLSGFMYPDAQRYVFRIEADGLVTNEEHEVEVRIVVCQATLAWPFNRKAEIKVIRSGGRA